MAELILVAILSAPPGVVERLSYDIFGPSAPMFLCVLHVESGRKHGVTGDGGRAYGIGQLHEGALVDACLYLKRKSCKPEALKKLVMRDVKEAVVLSAAYLRFMIDTFGGDVTKGIMAYHAGPLALQRDGYDWEYYGKVISCLRSAGH